MCKIINFPKNGRRRTVGKSATLKKIRDLNLVENLLASLYLGDLVVSNMVLRIITNFDVKIFFYYDKMDKLKIVGNSKSIKKWKYGGLKNKIEADLANYLINSGQYFIVDLVEELGIEQFMYVDNLPNRHTTERYISENSTETKEKTAILPILLEDNYGADEWDGK